MKSSKIILVIGLLNIFISAFGQTGQRISLFKTENIMHKYFKEALESGDNNKIKMYLDSGINLNVAWDFKGHIRNYTGITPLVYSIKLNKLDIAKSLIEKGADVNFKYSIHESYIGNYNMQAWRDVPTTTLNEVIRLGNVEGIKLLLDSGADKNSGINEAKTTNNEKIINLFKEKGASIVYTTSDLENATEQGKDYNYIKGIVDQGVKGSGWALLSAVNRSDKAIIDLIIKSGVSVNTTVYTKTGASWCAMCTAVNNGNLDIVKYLVEEKNANINVNCQIKDYASNSSQTLTDFSDSPNCWKRNRNITEYLILAPSIQKKKQEDNLKKGDEYIKNAEKLLSENNIESAKIEYDKAFNLTNIPNHKKEYAIMLYFYSKKEYGKVIEVCDYFDSKGNSYYHQQYKGFSYLYLNKKDLAFDVFNKNVQNNPSKTTYLDLGCFYSFFNEPKNAIVNIEKSLKLGFNSWSYLESEPTLNNIRDSKEFKKLINKFKK